MLGEHVQAVVLLKQVAKIAAKKHARVLDIGVAARNGLRVRNPQLIHVLEVVEIQVGQYARKNVIAFRAGQFMDVFNGVLKRIVNGMEIMHALVNPV